VKFLPFLWPTNYFNINDTHHQYVPFGTLFLFLKRCWTSWSLTQQFLLLAWETLGS
jgi:hypothetical protein